MALATGFLGKISMILLIVIPAATETRVVSWLIESSLSSFNKGTTSLGEPVGYDIDGVASRAQVEVSLRPMVEEFVHPHFVRS